jgi:hypothetical protein
MQNKIDWHFPTALVSMTLPPTKPREAFLAEYLIPRIDEDDRGVILVYVHPAST